MAGWFTSATAGRASALGATCTVADLAVIDLPFLDEPEEPSTGRYVHAHTRRWSELVAGADAFVICTPEYNHAMPAALKNAFDALSVEWAHKPVGFVSYGNTSAGTRAAQMATGVAVTLGMVPVRTTVSLRLAEAFAGDELVADPRRDAAAVRLLDELLHVAAVLAPLRVPHQTMLDQPGVVGLTIAPAIDRDAGELLVLQRCCWVAEAVANETLDLPALREPLDVVAAAIEEQPTWVLRDGARIIGSVRARSVGSTWQIQRLMVAPDRQGRGLGRFLLSWAEAHAPDATQRFELFTGAGSTRNLRVYAEAGYSRQPVAGGVAQLHKRRPVRRRRSLTGA